MRKVGSLNYGSQISLDPENKLSLSVSDRKPNLPEKIEIVNSWFASFDPKNDFKLYRVSIDRVAEFFV